MLNLVVHKETARL